MQVNGRQAEEVKLVYESFINSLFGAELERYASFLSEDYRLIGTTEGEVFISRKEAVDFLEKTSAQLVGNIERRNGRLHIESVDELMFITDLFDAWVRVEDTWIFYAKARVTSWLKNDAGTWKMIQQHFSIPDSKAQEGQTIGLEKISQENLELRDAIKRRTVELEKKNRELEVEASLERVRAGAMGMQKREDMLNICRTISAELTQLGIKEIRNVQTAIFYPEKGNYLNYEYYQKHDREIFTEVDFAGERIHKDQRDFANTMLSGEGAFYTKNFSGEELKQWYSYQSGTEQLADEYLLHAHSLNYYWFSLGAIAIGISTYYPLAEEESQLFKRFRNVFNLSYRRYLDIEKAEIQAREAQVEASLERVRSRSLGMLKSDELSEVIQVVYQQLIHLGIPVSHAGFVMDYKERDDYRIWIADEFRAPAQVTVPYFDAIYYKQFNEAKKSGLNFFTTRLNFEEKNKFYQDLFKHIPGFPEESKVKILSEPGFTISTVLLENVALYIENFSGVPFSDEENLVLTRFGKVFQQAYTRFLDLQKAEAQAKEALIEGALEKVRSSSLAMHKSDELKSVIVIVFEKLKELGLTFDVAGIQIYTENSRDIFQWVAALDLISSPVLANLPYSEEDFKNCEIIRDVWTAKEEGKNFQNKNYSFEEKNKFFEYAGRYNNAITMPFDVREFQLRAPGYTQSLVAEKHSALWVDSYKGQTILNEEFSVLKRFAHVFEQAYVRFLDLQKAEEQAREAQIEASLERVRSRSLAMHNTSELQEVIHIVHKELLNLKIAINGGSFIAINKDVGPTLRCWGSGGTADTTEEVRLPLYEKPFCTDLINGIRNGAGFFTEEFTKEEKVEFFTFLFGYEPWSKLDPKQKNETLSSPGGYTRSCYVSRHTSIFIINHYGEKFSAAENEILRRFGIVFEQSFTRFLDLQKAEAQAREAGIEAALEKVRSRTMAMQRSDELAASAAVMFQQIKSLGIESYTSGFNIWDEDKDSLTSWMSNPTGALNPPFIMPAREYEQHNRFYEAWKNGEQFIVDDLTGERARAHYTYLRSFPLLEKSFAMAEEAGIRTPDRQVHNVVFFSHGYLLFVTLEPKPEWQDLFKRFGQVFQQTYTRFLDLEKAEAQTIRAEKDLIEIKAARRKAEDTLLELQATQKQLIQAEKMASLGELTAGIAHEIQNPLNFVNNFSEVSAELTEEAESKRQEAGENSPLVTELLHDIKESLSKINHHGKRADAIVKGMLQHSQSRSGIKEPTDIKELIDEYVKLALHGYKARNKSFEVTINASYDKSIEKINIVPQEIGRVLLNLFNNAFYACAAVNRREAIHGVSTIDNHNGNIVSIMTKRVGNNLEITVTDNGTGIDPKIIDKIFQPFFTTKPTGQGTGLGLSLAYDIIKSHDGELKVRSEAGKETTFIIQLPIS